MSKPMGNGPGGLPVFPAGIDLGEVRLREGAFFWEEIQRLSAEMPLTALVGDLMGQEDAPRVWVFLDAPERTVSRTVAVLAAARALARRGKRVLVIDGDDRNPDLSRWVGRFETEGWLDFARYGASLQVCSVPLPWDPESGYLMGVGSYNPAWMTAEEANRLVTRMLALTDYVLVSAPVGEGGAPWAAVPSMRLICWDREDDSRERIEEMIRDARLIGDRPKAVVAFGSADEARPGRRPVPTESGAGSSPVFRWLAAALVVVVLGLAGWWFIFAGGEIPGRSDRESPVPGYAAAPSATADREPAAAGDGSGLPAAAADTTGSPAAADDDSVSAPVTEVVSAEPVIAESAAESPAAEEPAAEEPVVAEPVVAEPAVEEAAAAEPAPAVDWAGEVAAAGWALHVYSLADSASAAEEKRMMLRRGVNGAVRAWTTDDGKTWFRLYAGSFPDRKAANAAAAELKDILGTDWAAPARLDR